MAYAERGSRCMSKLFFQQMPLCFYSHNTRNATPAALIRETDGVGLGWCRGGRKDPRNLSDKVFPQNSKQTFVSEQLERSETARRETIITFANGSEEHRPRGPRNGETF